MTDRNFTYTLGALDGVSVQDGKVVVSGWVVGLESGITDLKLECDGQRLLPEETRFNTPSPDVKQVWSDLAQTESCRFQVVAKLPEASGSAGEGRLISVAPMANEMRGVPLERIVPSQLPVPTADQSVMVGHGDFVETSFSMFSLFKLIGGLERDARVLDPGCGLGRIAYALAHYLSEQGRYEGFDVSAEAIALAKSIFAGKKNFSFQQVDLYNKMYNPDGKIRSADFKFPFADQSFDFVILTSVFTHMLADDIRRYLAEISRTLDSGGRCFATFFAIDEMARKNLDAGRTHQKINHRLSEHCYVENRSVPENAIAYDFLALSEMIAEAGLCIEQVHWGRWSGHHPFLSYQDVFLLGKA